ncbi:hypothetical protein [Agromyces sp. SYSU T00194]|uniref:hypothetical protein n=1 Tax=Agromyces chitinivorans TaxID=3158560 RepID=UPI003392B87B
MRWRANKPLTIVATSEELAQVLEAQAQPVHDAMAEDPNEFYRKTLRMKRFVSSGARGRVSIQIGTESRIGARVEAKRGTMAKAISRAGL